MSVLVAFLCGLGLIWLLFILPRRQKREIEPLYDREEKLETFLKKLLISGRAFMPEHAMLMEEQEAIETRLQELEKSLFENVESDSVESRLSKLEEARRLEKRLEEVERSIKFARDFGFAFVEEYREADRKLQHTKRLIEMTEARHARWR